MQYLLLQFDPASYGEVWLQSLKNRDIWDEDEGSLGLLWRLSEASPTPTQDMGAFTLLCLAFFSHPYALRAQVDFDRRPAPWAATHTLFRTLGRTEWLDAVPEFLIQVNLSSKKSIISAQRWQNTCLSRPHLWTAVAPSHSPATECQHPSTFPVPPSSQPAPDTSCSFHCCPKPSAGPGQSQLQCQGVRVFSETVQYPPRHPT